MKFVTVISLSSGILLFSLPKKTTVNVDPYQRAAVFFTLFQTSLSLTHRCEDGTSTEEDNQQGISRIVMVINDNYHFL